MSNAIGFVLMGGVAVVVAACSFVKAKAKDAVTAGKLMNYFKAHLGCSNEHCYNLTVLTRGIIKDYAERGEPLNVYEIQDLLDYTCAKYRAQLMASSNLDAWYQPIPEPKKESVE